MMERVYFKNNKNEPFVVDNDKYCTDEFIESYKATQNLVEIEKSEYDSILEEQNTPDFETLKANKITEIKNDCTAQDPHTIFVTLADASEKNITFNGGDGSASAISGAVTLAESNGATTVQLWDYSDALYTISLTEAFEIAKKIGGKYQNDMIKRQTLITQVNNATTKEEVNAISWS